MTCPSDQDDLPAATCPEGQADALALRSSPAVTALS